MKNLILTLIISILLVNCSKSDDSKFIDKTVWKGVFYDGISNTDVHDPQYNYTLIINSLNNVEVISPTEGVEDKIISIEILNDSEIDMIWKLQNGTRKIRSTYHYNNQNELIIDRFTYTVATIPFPNNLASAKFIKNTHINNQ